MVTEKLMNYTGQLSRTDLMEIGNGVSFTSIIRSNEPIFKDVVKRGDEVNLTKAVFSVAAIFMADNFPDQNGSDISVQFAKQIINREPTWELGDIVNFFDFIVMRQDLPELKVYGNKITPFRLMEMVSVYNEHKAEERERIVAEEKGKFILASTRENSETSIKALMGKELERIQIRDDDKKSVGVTPDEKYFNPQINLNGTDNS